VPHPRDDDDEELAPRRKKRIRRPARSGNSALWVFGSVGVGVLLLAAFAVVLMAPAPKRDGGRDGDRAAAPSAPPAPAASTEPPAPAVPSVPAAPLPPAAPFAPPSAPDVVNPPVVPKARTLQGTWEVVSIELNGRRQADPLPVQKIVIAGNLMTTHLASGRKLRSQIRVDARRTPMEIDLRSAGRTYPGIYKIEGDTLTICINETGAARPVAFSSVGTVGSGGVTTYRFVE
jgi:uncharacterized protein (TIGR03067 family)